MDWNEDWGDWEDADKGRMDFQSQGEDSDISSRSSPTVETSWLTESIIAASPTSDLMAVGYKNRLVILTYRWESFGDEVGKMRLVNTWRGTVGFSPSDEIRAILCLPLVSQKQSSAGGPDWTCVIVGFSSGYVAMYTELSTKLITPQCRGVAATPKRKNVVPPVLISNWLLNHSSTFSAA
ncbi:Rab3 GTPase-activating protein non-catalytic subunit [Halocaridina rubra]|uniref:Rab3 GTPase-activating protein non-catalytic subunit n=1 Tax=Halocaridina rubra TaxID=373956 RepID=A0AAN8WVD9_HALRR